MKFRRTFLIILLGAVSVAACNLVIQSSSSCNLNASEPRKITSGNYKLRPLWSIQVGIDNFSTDSRLINAENLFVSAIYCQGLFPDYEIVALNALTGQLVWQTKGVDASSLTYDSVHKQIYSSGVGNIRALSALNGKILWENNSAAIFARVRHPIDVLPDGELVTYAVNIWKIDPNTGNISNEPLNLPSNTFLDTGTMILTEEHNLIRSTDITGKILWESEITGRTPINNNYWRPFISGKYLIFHGGILDSGRTIIDADSGKVLWEISNYDVISNLAISGNIGYALDTSSKLHVFDVARGIEIGLVEFEAPSTQATTPYGAGLIAGSWISIHNDIVAIYFQDTDELSVYEME